MTREGKELAEKVNHPNRSLGKWPLLGRLMKTKKGKESWPFRERQRDARGKERRQSVEDGAKAATLKGLHLERDTQRNANEKKQ